MADEVIAEAGQDNTATASEAKPAVVADKSAAPAQTAADKPDAAPEGERTGEFQSMLADQPEKKTDAATEKKEPGEAVEFEAKLPEGSVVDEPAMAAVKECVKSGEIKPETAQKLIDQHMEALNRRDAYIKSEALKQVDAWEGEIKNHPEFGGVNLAKNVESAKLVLQKYGSPRLVSDFQKMGVLSHPEFAFMLMRMHKVVGEGESIAGAGQATPEPSAAAIYPSMGGK